MMITTMRIATAALYICENAERIHLFSYSKDRCLKRYTAQAVFPLPQCIENQI